MHTQYDGKGIAYTSLFVESTITKWKLPPWTDDERKDLNKIILDKMPAHFNIGHLVVGGSDTGTLRQVPGGDEQAVEGPPRHVGPSQPESSQLIDITGDKMTMLDEAYTEPEPHFAQILKVTRSRRSRSIPKAENNDPNAVWDKAQTGVTRTGNKVKAKMMAIRSRFVPDRIDAQVGDELTIHVTNVEQTRDMIHGLGIIEHDMNVVIDPGETKTFHLKPTSPASFRSTAPTSARRSTRRCRAISSSQTPGSSCQARITAHPRPEFGTAGPSRAQPAAHPRSGHGKPGSAAPARRQPRHHKRLRGRRKPAAVFTFMQAKIGSALQWEFRFLHKPLNFWSRLFLLAAAVTIVAALFFPLWKMHLVAPQYSDGLDLYIFSYKIEGGGFNGQHLVEINNLNHYIGMKPIAAGGLHGDALDAFRLRTHHSADPALNRVRRNEQRGRSFRALFLLRHLLHRLVLVPALRIRA